MLLYKSTWVLPFAAINVLLKTIHWLICSYHGTLDIVLVKLTGSFGKAVRLQVKLDS